MRMVKTNEHQGEGLKAADLFRYLFWTAVIIAGVMSLYFLGLQSVYRGNLSQMSSFGDAFGPIGIFISGVTFFVLILSLILQRNHQQEEFARAAAAQEEANRIARLGFQVETLKSRIAWHTAFIQRGGCLSENADAKVRRLVEQLESLLERNGIEMEPPRDH